MEQTAERSEVTGARMTVRGISKTFPGTRALDDVSMDVRPGEIHALVGGNGSGKSTLIKILMGIHQADEGGEFEIDGAVTSAAESSPDIAKAAGIHAVHQDLGVFPDLSVAENLAIGHGYETGRSGKVQWSRLERRAQKLIERFEIPARPSTKLASLSQGARTQVAIARALQDDDGDSRGLLILDEPTASLPAHEVDLLMTYLRRYASQGQAILYVSHRLDEVLSLSDRVTVLRDGRKVGTYDTAQLTENQLIELIVGRKVERVFPAMPAVEDGKPILQVSGLAAGPLTDVSFELARGEVVGIAGLLGSGRTELMRAIFGDLKWTAGTMTLDGKAHAPRRALDGMRAGVVYVPEDRAKDAAFADLPLFENASMANIGDYWSGGLMRTRRMRNDGRSLMKEYLVKAQAADALLSTLSGGNQQKVVLARWLRRKPLLMLLDEPTQGVDVGARAEIYALVRESVAAGASALVVASDAEELSHVCDRVLLLGRGRIVSELRPPDLDAERLIQSIYQTVGDE